MSLPPAESFDEALLGHRAWVRTVVRSRLVEAADVDDVVSDVMTAAVMHQRNGNSIGQLTPWLYRVAVRKVLLFKRNCGRRRKKIHRYSQRQLDEAQRLWYQTPLEWALGNERQGLITEAMQRLSGRDAEILRFKYVHGWSYQQIADRLGVSKTKVTHRLRSARAKLKANLQQLGVDDVDE